MLNDYQNSQVQGSPAWIVNDWTRHIKVMSSHRFVRCVSGDDYAINDFIDNGDGTVTDTATGLMWAQDDNGAALNWQDALAYAEGAEIAGYDDWRLPDIKELQSRADHSGALPAINDSVFNLSEFTNPVLDPGTAAALARQVTSPFYWSSASNSYVEAYHEESGDDAMDDVSGYTNAWIISTGYMPDINGWHLHGAGAIVFDTKAEEVSYHSGIEVFYHHVRLVRGRDVTVTVTGNPSTVNPDWTVAFPDGVTAMTGGPGAMPDFAAAAAALGITAEALNEAMGEPSGDAPDFSAIAEAPGVREADLTDAPGNSEARAEPEKQ